MVTLYSVLLSGRGREADVWRPAARLHDQPGDDASNGEKTHTIMLSMLVYDFCILWFGLYLFNQGFVQLRSKVEE